MGRIPIVRRAIGGNKDRDVVLSSSTGTGTYCGRNQ